MSTVSQSVALKRLRAITARMKNTAFCEDWISTTPAACSESVPGDHRDES